MGHSVDTNGSKWIAHVIDHFTKFNILWAMSKKEAKYVVEGLKERVFGYFGLPNILQSDNGTEFKNEVVRKMIKNWIGDCELRYGQPRRPQTQGLVEQSNGTITSRLDAIKNQEEIDYAIRNLNKEKKETVMPFSWADHLPEVM